MESIDSPIWGSPFQVYQVGGAHPPASVPGTARSESLSLKAGSLESDQGKAEIGRSKEPFKEIKIPSVERLGIQ